MATERAVYRLPDLQKLIDPKSVAVVGASATLGSFGQRTLANLAGFHGKVFGVNPKYREIAGRECFPSLTDLPEAPDCVVLCVARTQGEESLGQAIRLGVGGAIAKAGPSVIVAYLAGGILSFLVLMLLVEMAVGRPVAGSFQRFAGSSLFGVVW